MAKALEQIRNLEREIGAVVELRYEMKQMLEICRTDFTRATVNLQIRMLSNRIARAQAEIFAIGNLYFADIQKSLRDEKYPPVRAAQKSVIRYADE